MKTVPTMLLAVALLSRRYVRAQPLFPARHTYRWLILAALMMQVGGNLGFQVALGHIGLAITVPLVFAFIIGAGAFLGRIYLGDRVSPQTVLSLAIMTLSIILLSYAATIQNSAPGADSGVASSGIVWFGILMAVVSGLSYGINGVVIRAVTRHLLPVESLLLLYSATGLITLGFTGAIMMGSERLLAIRADEWVMMLSAGTFNAAAFFCVTHALKLMNVSHVNVLNASQNALCAIAAVIIFSEPVSTPMIAGITLSILGFLALDRDAPAGGSRGAGKEVAR